MDVISFMIAVVIVDVVVRQRSRNALKVVRNVMPTTKVYVTYSKLSQNLHVVHRKSGIKVICIVFFTTETEEKWEVNSWKNAHKLLSMYKYFEYTSIYGYIYSLSLRIYMQI